MKSCESRQSRLSDLETYKRKIFYSNRVVRFSLSDESTVTRLKAQWPISMETNVTVQKFKKSLGSCLPRFRTRNDWCTSNSRENTLLLIRKAVVNLKTRISSVRPTRIAFLLHRDNAKPHCSEKALEKNRSTQNVELCSVHTAVRI